MFLNKRCARLILKTEDITGGTSMNDATHPTLSSNAGYCDYYKTNFVWTNIDWRVVLGDMYNEYDEFALVLNKATFDQSINGFGGSSSARVCKLNVKMLPLLNCTYNQTKNVVWTNGCIGILNFNLAVFGVSYLNNSLIFSKPTISNINIYYTQTISDSTANTQNANSQYPDVLFEFIIYPIEKNVAK